MKIYVHQEAQEEAEAIDVPTNSKLGELVAGKDRELFVLLEDTEDPLDLEMTIDESGIDDRAHLFVGQRHRVDVDVLFNGERHTRTFSASTRVSRVFKWAVGKQAFDLSEADAAEHTLALLANDVVPPGDAHLGSLDDSTPGRVAFALIPKHRYEG